MAKRIYALAKELKIENKQLLEYCARAGITGKGSALASLTDEEVAKVKAVIAGGGKAPAKGTKAAGPGKERTPAAPLSRDMYVPPRKPEKIKVLDGKPKKPAGEGRKKGAEAKPPQPREQVVHLAEMPEVKQPTPQPKEEPKVQKPVIALSKEEIAGAKKGKMAPLQQYTESHKKRAGKDKKSATVDLVTGAPLGQKPGRGRRGKGDHEDVAGMGDLRRGRTEQRKSRSKRVQLEEEEAPSPTTRTRIRTAPKGQRRSTAAPRKEKVVVQLPCTVRSFSEAVSLPAARVCLTLTNLLGAGPGAVNINSQIDPEAAALLAEELGVDVELKAPASLEETVLQKIEQQEDAPESLQPRPPIVTFLGHVDHGKTSLLDRIIGTNVVSREAGGITQHIRAYEIDRDGRKIAFVDTPGHEAFTEMRARGANVTDIAVLVVAADDGVMPQTEEAISHAKAAGVPIVVALNKIDLPGANPDMVLQQLASRELLPSQWGGDIEVVQTSAVTGQGIDELLETLLVTAELHEYKANPDRPAVGICLEAEQEAGRGVIAKVIVQRGTLHVGDIILCGCAHGRVKAMYDTLNPRRRRKTAGPSTPVNITGLDTAPEAGDRFYVLDDIATARQIAEQRELQSRERSLAGITTKISFEEFQRRLEEGKLTRGDEEVVTLNLIIRADVQGSIEAIQKELAKLDHPEVRIKVLHASVGAITSADVALAHASQAVIIGFNVIPDEGARAQAEKHQVEIRRYDVIYKLTDDIRDLLAGKLKPEQRLVELGHAVVKEVFHISRTGTIAGCHVTGGTIQRGCRIRVNREGRTIGDYALESLRRHKEDAKEVPRGMECGMKLAGFNDVKVGDVLEAYRIEEVARTL